VSGSWCFASWVAGSLGAVLAALLTLTPFFERLELRTQDARFQLRGPRLTHAHIVIGEIAQSTLKAWPEPINRWGIHYARAIQQARKLGATWIGLDFIPTVSGGSESDAALKAALAGGRVVLANARPAGKEPVNPLDEFLFADPEQPVNVGFIDARPELDDVVRHAAVFDPGPNGPVPSLPAVLELRVRGQSPTDRLALRALARPSAREAGPGTIWINYVGPSCSRGLPGAFPCVRLERLAAGNLTPAERSAVRGAVVLIGGTALDFNDRARGAGDEFYSGVEIHAHTLATLLDGRSLRRAAPAQEALMTAVVGSFTAAVLAFLPLGWGLALGVMLAGAWWWSCMRAFQADSLWPAAGPLLAIGLGWVGQSSFRAMAELRRRLRIQGLFERYMPRAVADDLLRHPAHLRMGGTELEASILFLDIRGFTALSQGRAPTAVMDELNELFAEIVPVIDRCGGLLFKYTGDGLLAVFGAPQPLENHAEAAVKAAAEIVEVSRRLSASRVLGGGKAVRVGCGINSGLVVCGNLGREERVEYTVIGDTVNLAARLEELNKAPELNTEFPSEVVISGATYDRLSDPPPVRGPFELAIRGRQGPLRLYQVNIPHE
jgi:adenylate cyclase